MLFQYTTSGHANKRWTCILVLQLVNINNTRSHLLFLLKKFIKCRIYIQRFHMAAPESYREKVSLVQSDAKYWNIYQFLIIFVLEYRKLLAYERISLTNSFLNQKFIFFKCNTRYYTRIITGVSPANVERNRTISC
jgi:hypothetical protein